MSYSSMEARVRRALEIVGGDVEIEERSLDDREGFLRSLTADKIVELMAPHVVGQEAETRELAEWMCLWLAWHFAIKDGADRMALPAMKALSLTGTTASGKTYLVGVMCSVLGLKLVKVNFAALSGEGWRGQTFSSYLFRISKEQEADPNAIFVLFCDEVDKTADCGSRGGIDQSWNAQTDALAPMDCAGTYSAFYGSNGSETFFEVDMTSVAWINAGAYTGIGSVVRKRLLEEAGGESYGLLSDGSAAEIKSMTEEELRRRITPADLVNAGMLREFIGRSSHIINLPSLTIENLASIVIGSENSLRNRYQLLMPDGVELDIETAAANALAASAVEHELGARHLEASLAPMVAHALDVARRSDVRRIGIGYDEQEFRFCTTFQHSNGEIRREVA